MLCNEENTMFKYQLTAGIEGSEILEILPKCNDANSFIMVLEKISSSKNEQIVFIFQNSKSFISDAVRKAMINSGVEKFISISVDEKDTSVSNFRTASEFLRSNIADFINNSVVIVYNSSEPTMQQIAQALYSESDRAILSVNVDAMKHNLSYFRDLIGHKTKFLACLKGSCHGAGVNRIGNILQKSGIDYVAVAYVSEGIQFRTKGITVPILVFNPSIQTYDKILRYDLEPAIYSMDMIKKLNSFVENKKKCINIHLEIESGFNRHGFADHDVSDLIELIPKLHPNIKIRAIFSLLSGGSKLPYDDFVKEQAEQFTKMSSRIERETGIEVLKHLDTTNSTIRFPEYHFSMVRVGSGIFGLSGIGHMQLPLKEVMTLSASVSQVNCLDKGSTVSYNQSFTVTEYTEVAVIDIGYVDGLKRALGCGIGTVMIKGRPCSILGLVCMDMCMVDVTGLDVHVGERAVIFCDDGISLRANAAAAGSFLIEVLCNVHGRVKRVLHGTLLEDIL